MKYKNRDGEIVEEEEKGKKITSFFYGTKLGRMLLKPLVSPVWQRFLFLHICCGFCSADSTRLQSRRKAEFVYSGGQRSKDCRGLP